MFEISIATFRGAGRGQRCAFERGAGPAGCALAAGARVRARVARGVLGLGQSRAIAEIKRKMAL